MTRYEPRASVTLDHSLLFRVFLGPAFVTKPRSGQRKQDPLNPRKYRYVKAFDDLAADNTHIIAIVLFRFSEGQASEPVLNNYIVTAYQKEIG